MNIGSLRDFIQLKNLPQKSIRLGPSNGNLPSRRSQQRNMNSSNSILTLKQRLLRKHKQKTHCSLINQNKLFQSINRMGKSSKYDYQYQYRYIKLESKHPYKKKLSLSPKSMAQHRKIPIKLAIPIQKNPQHGNINSLASFFSNKSQENEQIPISKPFSISYHIQSPYSIGKRFPNMDNLPVSSSESLKLKKHDHPLLASLIKAHQKELKSLSTQKTEVDKSLQTLRSLGAIEERIRFQKNLIKRNNRMSVKKKTKIKDNDLMKDQSTDKVPTCQNRRQQRKIFTDFQVKLNKNSKGKSIFIREEGYYRKALNKSTSPQEKQQVYRNRKKVVQFLQKRNKMYSKTYNIFEKSNSSSIHRNKLYEKKLSSILNFNDQII